MADVVQYKLEKMVEELEDLERRGIFSRREIAEIVKQRRKFEYRLKRPSPLKQDFLAYIDYEKQLNELRRLRKKVITRQLRDLKSTEKRKKLKKTISDFAGVVRIVEIYRLATNKFKGDIQLWFQYLEFCRQRRNGRMKKVLAQVIRFHPKVPGIWIYAAAWEFDHNLNAAAARALMQSGLRACPTSEELWVEYLRMELTYLNKLKARKVALGEDEGKLVKDRKDVDEKQWREENAELFVALEEKKENADAKDAMNEESKKNLEFFRVQALNIFRTVYSGAVEALPLKFSLRAQFLDILAAIDIAHSDEMQKEILNDMKKDFSQEPEYWDWLAKRETEPGNAQGMISEILPDRLQKAIQVYEEALEVVPSARIFNLYLKFLMDAISQQNGEAQDSQNVKTAGYSIDLISQALKIYEKADQMQCLTEDLACGHISFLLQLGRLDEAKMLAEKLSGGKLKNAVNLCGLRLSIEMRCLEKKSSCPSKADLSFIFEFLSKFLMEVTISEAESLWLMAIKFLFNYKKFFDKLVELSFVLLAKYGGCDGTFSLSSTIVNLVLQRDGVKVARDTYKRYLALPRPGLAVYRCCIQLELNLACAGENDCLARARKLLESALSTYDRDVGLWRDYYSMEVKIGTSETAAAIHWRARKKLGDKVIHIACRDT